MKFLCSVQAFGAGARAGTKAPQNYRFCPEPSFFPGVGATKKARSSGSNVLLRVAGAKINTSN